MTERDDPERLAIAGVLHRVAPEEFEGEPLDWLCEDEVCLWYDIADNLMKRGYTITKREH